MSPEMQIAADILKRALDFENKNRFTEAVTCYQEGLQVLLNVIKSDRTSDENRNKLRSRFEEFVTRVEKLKKQIESEKYHEQIIIENNSCNHSYQSIFGRFLDEIVTEIEIDDPYVRLYHQCQNFLKFCQLATKSCVNLKKISLTTVENNAEQIKWLLLIQRELQSRFKISLILNYSSTLHDREIRFNNGWIIKVGRGLDIYKKAEHDFSFETLDLDLRKCYETTVDIFHSKDLRKSQS